MSPARFARRVVRHWQARRPSRPLPAVLRDAATVVAFERPELARRPLFAAAVCFAASIAEDTPALRGNGLRVCAMAVDVLPVLEKFAVGRGPR